MATASSTTPLQEAVDLLGSALWILDLFAHRNKNQHRLSKWWAQFDMLRRNTRRLVADVQACLEAQARSSSSSSSLKKKQKKVAAAGAVGTSSQRERAEDAATRRMEARVRFMAEQIVPKAFLAFTQLAADNQYAHLGLALLGALAQVHTAVASLVPVPDDGLKSDAVSPAGTVVRRDVPEESDLGVVISRSEIEQGVPLRADKTKVKKPTVDDGVLESTETRNQDESTGAGPRDSRNGAEKLKKLKKDRDEFDSLFDSLEAKPAKEEEEEAEERRRVR